jgi:hypothetical protein
MSILFKANIYLSSLKKQQLQHHHQNLNAAKMNSRFWANAKPNRSAIQSSTTRVFTAASIISISSASRTVAPAWKTIRRKGNKEQGTGSLTGFKTEQGA